MFSLCIEGGRTLVPLRAVAASMGFTVGWDAAERKITLTKDDLVLTLWVDQTKVLINGGEGHVDVAPQIKDGRTYVPVRFLAENMGAKVSWDGTTGTVAVTPGAARALLEKSMTGTAGNLRSSGSINTVLKMSGGALPGSITMETPMELTMLVYGGEALSTTKTTVPLSGQKPVVNQVAIKGGKMYVTDSTTNKWTVVGDSDPNNPLDLSKAVPGGKSSLDPMKLGEDMLKGAVITFGATENVNGVSATQINIDLPQSALDKLVGGMISAITPEAAGGEGIKIGIQRFRISQWVTDTGTTVKEAIDLAAVMTILDPKAGAVTVEMTMTGTITTEPLTEPIQFPDLTGTTST